MANNPEEIREQRHRDNHLLHSYEDAWKDRYEFLKDHGYLLRPRYRPGWTPSWPNSDRYPQSRHEDAVLPLHSRRLDAERISDGRPVFLKLAPKSSPEIEIGKILATPQLRDDPRNHCVPVFDLLDDPVDPEGAIVVVPLLRPIQFPPPSTIGEFIPLIEQTLEALVFLHEHEIAHRDCSVDNIMMDARALYPEGWHPQAFLRTANNTEILPLRSIREMERMYYYLIDFGLATYKQNPVTGIHGQERAPELSDQVPYDPYKLDVYILGTAYKRFFEMLYQSPDFKYLEQLTDYMTPEDPAARPTASEAYERFKTILADIPAEELSRRLPPSYPETFIERLWNDIEHYIWTRWRSYWTTKRAAEPLT